MNDSSEIIERAAPPKQGWLDSAPSKINILKAKGDE